VDSAQDWSSLIAFEDTDTGVYGFEADAVTDSTEEAALIKRVISSGAEHNLDINDEVRLMATSDHALELPDALPSDRPAHTADHTMDSGEILHTGGTCLEQMNGCLDDRKAVTSGEQNIENSATAKLTSAADSAVTDTVAQGHHESVNVEGLGADKHYTISAPESNPLWLSGVENTGTDRRRTGRVRSTLHRDREDTKRASAPAPLTSVTRNKKRKRLSTLRSTWAVFDVSPEQVLTPRWWPTPMDRPMRQGQRQARE
jgi:hypothetical protein